MKKTHISVGEHKQTRIDLNSQLSICQMAETCHSAPRFCIGNWGRKISNRLPKLGILHATLQRVREDAPIVQQWHKFYGREPAERIHSWLLMLAQDKKNQPVNLQHSNLSTSLQFNSVFADIDSIKEFSLTKMLVQNQDHRRLQINLATSPYVHPMEITV